MTDRKNKRGFTLAELCIVLALIGVITTMVVSLCALVNSQSVSSTETQAYITTVEEATDAFEEWLSYFDSTEYTLEVITENEKQMLCAYSSTDDKYYKFGMFVEKSVSGNLPNTSKIVQAKAEKLLNVEFEIEIDKYGEKSLITMTLFCNTSEINKNFQSEDNVTYKTVKMTYAVQTTPTVTSGEVSE